MPAQAKGARLWLRKARRDARGKITHPAVWLILDGKHQESTECSADDSGGAEKKLEAYLNRKHFAEAKKGVRDPAQIPVADVLSLYAADIVPQHARPHETIQRIQRLAGFFGMRVLSDINGDLCRAYGRTRGTPAAARRDLEELRAAINHHRQEGHCDKIVSVALPEKSVSREHWMTREQAAKLLWTAWRYREIQKGFPTGRHSRRHLCRFILVGLYTGTRAAAICGAALEPMEGHGWIDLERGIFYRRPAGERETKKRRPPIPLPQKLLAHMRRWKRSGQRYAVEWNREPVKDVDKAFRNLARSCGLPWVTPHVLRHTAATWLMQAGTPKWVAAGFLGMTPETLDNVYGHHHPGYMVEAVEAFDRPPTLRQRKAATEHEPEQKTRREAPRKAMKSK